MTTEDWDSTALQDALDIEEEGGIVQELADTADDALLEKVGETDDKTRKRTHSERSAEDSTAIGSPQKRLKTELPSSEDPSPSPAPAVSGEPAAEEAEENADVPNTPATRAVVVTAAGSKQRRPKRVSKVGAKRGRPPGKREASSESEGRGGVDILTTGMEGAPRGQEERTEVSAMKEYVARYNERVALRAAKKAEETQGYDLLFLAVRRFFFSLSNLSFHLRVKEHILM